MWDKRAARVVVTVLSIAALLAFCWAAWRTLMAFVFGIFFAYLLEAPVERLMPLLKGSRKAAVAAVYLIMLGAIALLLLLAAPRVVHEVQHLSQQLPQIEQKLASGQIAYLVGDQRGWSAETERKVQEFLEAHSERIVAVMQTLLTRATTTLTSMWWLLLVPIVAVFFLLGGRKFRATIIDASSRWDRGLVVPIINDMDAMVGHFIRTQLALAGLAMLVLTLVFWAMHVPYAFAVGPAAGALEFIPVIGPLVGIALVLGVALVGQWSHLIALLVVLLVWRGVQDYVTSPKIMGSRLELHPLAVLFGVLAGGEVGGVLGVFLSIPVMATLRIVWRAWRTYRSPRPGFTAPQPTPESSTVPMTLGARPVRKG